MALKMSNEDISTFVDLFDPTFGGEYYFFLKNLEFDTPLYGNVDVDWLITLLAVYQGEAGYFLKGMNLFRIYIIGKLWWIYKDSMDDPNVKFDLRRFGQKNEIAAILAGQDLINGKITLSDLFGIDCYKYKCGKYLIHEKSRRFSDKKRRYRRYRKKYIDW